jgi:MoaA/NifB/PqqE/SkfB family radical SAM enzyme
MNMIDYYKIWSRIRRRKPIGFSIDVTHRCTLSCRTCYMKWYASKPELSVEEWKRILSSFPEDCRYYGAWTGGEPLLRAVDIEALIRLFKWNWVATNGTLKLPQWKNVSFLISIDGNEEIHNQQRGHWADIVRHVRKDCFVIYDITRLNGQEKILRETVDFWHKRCRGIIFGFYTPSVQDESGLLLNSDERRATVKIIQNLKETYSHFIVNSVKQLDLCCTTPWSENCPAGNCIVGLDAQGKFKKPCVMGPEVDCSQCGCAVPQFMYLVASSNLHAILSSVRILSKYFL